MFRLVSKHDDKLTCLWLIFRGYAPQDEAQPKRHGISSSSAAVAVGPLFKAIVHAARMLKRCGVSLGKKRKATIRVLASGAGRDLFKAFFRRPVDAENRMPVAAVYKSDLKRSPDIRSVAIHATKPNTGAYATSPNMLALMIGNSVAWQWPLVSPVSQH
ncbi:hypothetical protein [uncultured Hoeflea sp.]|uniref:hypothetical protein n=1 Tax=uncultured Hoeflea sp. TaxID=538666 RepID=UPI0030DC3279